MTHKLSEQEIEEKQALLEELTARQEQLAEDPDADFLEIFDLAYEIDELENELPPIVRDDFPSWGNYEKPEVTLDEIKDYAPWLLDN